MSWSDKLRLVAPIIVYAALAFVAWKRGFLQEQTVTSAAQSSGVVWLAAVYVVVYAAVGALALPTGPLSYGSGAVSRGENKTPYLLAGAALLVVLALTFAPKLWDKFRKGRRKN